LRPTRRGCSMAQLPLSDVQITISGDQAKRWIDDLREHAQVLMGFRWRLQDDSDAYWLLDRQITLMRNDADWLEDAVDAARQVDHDHERDADRQQADREERSLHERVREIMPFVGE